PRALRLGVAGAGEGGAEGHGRSYSAAIVGESMRVGRTWIGSVAVAPSEPATGPEAPGLVLLDEVPVVRPPARPGWRCELGGRIRRQRWPAELEPAAPGVEQQRGDRAARVAHDHLRHTVAR